MLWFKKSEKVQGLSANSFTQGQFVLVAFRDGTDRVGLILEVLAFKANPTELRVVFYGAQYHESYVEWTSVKEIMGNIQFPVIEQLEAA